MSGLETKGGIFSYDGKSKHAPNDNFRCHGALDKMFSIVALNIFYISTKYFAYFHYSTSPPPLQPTKNALAIRKRTLRPSSPVHQPHKTPHTLEICKSPDLGRGRTTHPVKIKVNFQTGR